MSPKQKADLIVTFTDGDSVVLQRSEYQGRLARGEATQGEWARTWSGTQHAVAQKLDDLVKDSLHWKGFEMINVEEV